MKSKLSRIVKCFQLKYENGDFCYRYLCNNLKLLAIFGENKLTLKVYNHILLNFNVMIVLIFIWSHKNKLG